MPFLTEDAADLLHRFQVVKDDLYLLEMRLRSAFLSYLPPVGATKEDEDGWREITLIEWDQDGKPQFVVTDKHGNEDTLTVQQLGTGWRHE